MPLRLRTRFSKLWAESTSIQHSVLNSIVIPRRSRGICFQSSDHSQILPNIENVSLAECRVLIAECCSTPHLSSSDPPQFPPPAAPSRGRHPAFFPARVRAWFPVPHPGLQTAI